MGVFMGENLKNEIMGQSRHLFIYGYESEKRTDFLKSLEDDFDIVVERDSPIVIYMHDYYLPKVDISGDIDKFRLHQVNRERFNIALIKNILTRIKSKSDLLKDENVLTFLKRLSSITSDSSSYTNLEDFEKDLISSLDFYSLYHDKLVMGNSTLPNISDVKIPFIMPEMLVSKIKKMLVNNSYFGIIIDGKNDFSLETYKLVNGYVTRRINSDLSMKVVTEPEKWVTYYDNSGEFAEAVHDYGIVELDSSYSDHTKKMIKKYKVE